MSFKPTLYVMVGLPYSGKSTQINTDTNLIPLPIVDTDTYIEQKAKELGKTYREIFKDYYGMANRLKNMEIERLYKAKMSFILDQTNLSKSKRAHIIQEARKNGYRVIAYEFEPYRDETKLKARMNERNLKFIPLSVIRDMRSHFERVTEDEGFDEIVRIDNWGENDMTEECLLLGDGETTCVDYVYYGEVATLEDKESVPPMTDKEIEELSHED